MVSSDDRRAFFTALAPKRKRDALRHRSFYEDRIRWLQAIIPQNATIVDVGCGVGTVLSALPQEKKTGIDFCEAMIDIARAVDARSTYIIDDAEHLSLKERFEYVLLLDTINYLSDVQVALENIREKLTHPSSRLVITAYNFLWEPLFRMGELIGFKTKFPAQNWLKRSDITNLLDLAGFEVVETGGRILLPLGIPFLTTFFNRYLAGFPLLQRLCLIQTFIARPSPENIENFTVTVLSAMRNEKGNVRPITMAMPKLGMKTELLFIEGHSSDGTWEELESLMRAPVRSDITVRALKQPGKGKADALHHGIRESTGDILIVYDGDFTVHPQELKKLVDALSSGKAEFVNGSRLIYPMRGQAMPLLNLLGNKVFSLLFSWLFSQPMVDVLSPVKAFFRRDYARMTTRMDPFGDFDLFFGASLQHRAMRETPVHYVERTYGSTKMQPFRHAWLLLKMLFQGARRLKWM